MRVLLPLFFLPAAAAAEVVATSPSGFSLRHETLSEQSVEEVWDRLMQPSAWWDPNHTYSGDAENLSMGNEAGAYWREDWEEGSVIHGQLLLVRRKEELVLSAPFGPLLPIAATCRWTIRLRRLEDGSTAISSTHLVTGPVGSGVEALAGPVDEVIGANLERLAAAGLP
jgi:uncharacterized protein YndB with AHSA1/START domain